MIPVYICDDELEWVKKIEKALSHYQMQSDFPLETAYIGSSPEMLLSYLSAHANLSGIYFLDIHLRSNIDGLSLGCEIRKLDADAILIFVTTHEELMQETFHYHLRAMDFIIKDKINIQEQLFSVLQDVEKQLNTTSSNLWKNKITLKVGSDYLFISKKDIYYIDALPQTHKSLVHTQSGIHTVAQSVSELGISLGNEFVLCRKGCLVNLSHIHKKQLPLNLLLDNGETLQCSTRAWAKLSNLINLKG